MNGSAVAAREQHSSAQLGASSPPPPPPQMEVLLPMTTRFSNPIQCGGSWGFVRFHGFFT